MTNTRGHEQARDEHEQHFRGKRMSEIILGSQDGLVNVLGVLLGVASATSNILIVLVAGLAATLAETISMGAVAYTSAKAERDYYRGERKLEEQETKLYPTEEAQEIRDIYAKKGFRGKLLEQVVKVITSNRKVWVDTMMTEELNLSPAFEDSPVRKGLVVFVSTLIGSIIPLVPFFFLSISNGMAASVIFSVSALFAIGAVKGKLTLGSWINSGTELAVIGTVAALTGYLIGFWLGQIFGTNVVAIG